MPAYNLSFMQNATTIPKLVEYANHVTGDLFSGLLLTGIFIILVIKTHNDDLVGGLLAASFVTFIISGLFWFVGIANVLYPLAFLAILAFTTIYYVMSR